MQWEEFLNRNPKYLNLGSETDVHPAENYRDYIGVTPPERYQNKMIDLDTGKIIDRPVSKDDEILGDDPKILLDIDDNTFLISHDIEKRFPLPDESVDRVHSEDCFEHIESSKYPQIFREIYRILKTGGIFRLSVPDYLNPKDRFCLEKGYDPRNPLHITLTTKKLLEPYCKRDPWREVHFLHYWADEDSFVQNKIDYSKGHILRTPDNDPRNQNGNSLRITSLVIDLIK